MWFLRRRRRQLPLDLSSLERSLDRLAELVERIIGLIPELAAPRPDNPSAPPVEPAAAPAPEPVPEQAAEEHEAGHVLFAGGPNGYRLHERSGAPPRRGNVVELDAERFVVLRLGPSPLPGDRRRCAFLEREGPPRPEPTAGE
jgi:hypothetical protein